MKKIKLEHIDALSRGRKSGIKLGNRAIPHHLYVYEQEEYERALKRGYLIIDRTSRINLGNLWMLVSELYKRECIILQKIDEKGIVISNSNALFNGTLCDAKVYVKNLILKK